MEYANRRITCMSKDGYSLTFTEKGFTPFLLCSCDGVYTVANNVTMSDNTMTDGATFQGSVMKKRNIVLVLRDTDDFAYNRNLLNKLFKAGEAGTLVYEDELNTRQIEYYVESIESDGVWGSRMYTVSLLCDDPYFYEMDDITVELASWEDGFEFIHEFVAEGEQFGYRSEIMSQTIYNENAANRIGMEIIVGCLGAVQNPKITHVEQEKSITIGSSAKPFNMVSGDVLRITTGTNDKHVYLTHEGVTSEVNEYLTEDSEFIQLIRGANTIGYSAGSGASNMTLSITYRMRYTSA